ncbi:MAG TPA: hypothetical protein PLU36_05660 [Chitinophagaceae bacterium]|nr:META domain-containing protein [Chitinophagaceae bacterium]MCC6635185.1 DUF4847 family protein [Chitinophagaceae bacterium]HMZ46271.1 hypothetical protein [Chitinophagaceae bacterium]HNN31623.1 hypothetical protein [Chitinophagaceae bacterium]
MKSKINYILILLFSLTACNKDNTTTTSDSLNGKWKLVKYYNLTTGTIESEPSNISRSIILELSDNRIQGNISGHTVTNSVSGEYELLKDNKMKTLSFGGTKIGEPNWGDKFWDAIHATSSYERQSDKLYIYFNADMEKMEFKKL